MGDRWEGGPTSDVLVTGADGSDEGPECGDNNGGWICTRDPDHPGRHMAGTGDDRVAAAWPGTHEPTTADLTARPPVAETPEDQRAALVERIARAQYAGMSAGDPGPTVTWDMQFPGVKAKRLRGAEAVLSLLESGRAGVWLVPAAGVLDTVGVVIRQLRDTKAELAEARAEIERLRGSVSYWRDRAYQAENVRWDDSVAPGGEVCATCGVPVEDEPCPAHAPREAAEVERLKGQRDAARDDARDACRDRDLARAEVERLRELIEKALTVAECLSAGHGEVEFDADAEIDDIRREVGQP